MNHSCCPNVIVTYKGTLAEVRAVQAISPGEEVSVRLQRAVFKGRAEKSPNRAGRAGGGQAVVPCLSSGGRGPRFTFVTHDWESHAFDFHLVLATSIPEKTGQNKLERNSSQRKGTASVTRTKVWRAVTVCVFLLPSGGVWTLFFYISEFWPVFLPTPQQVKSIDIEKNESSPVAAVELQLQKPCQHSESSAVHTHTSESLLFRGAVQVAGHVHTDRARRPR